MAMQENQCPLCGRFMKYHDCSTENGFDYEYICKNPKCKTAYISSMGFGMATDGAMIVQSIEQAHIALTNYAK